MYSFLKNYSKHISVYYRIIKLLSVLTYTLTHFYVNKMLTVYLFKQQPQSRLSLIKALCTKLEKLNSVYIKIFQSLALNEDLLYDDEKDYLINYCDNVPYSNDCIDYKLLSDLHETYKISVLSAIPINSGIVGLVFDGYDSSNTKVVVKMLKRNIINELRDLFDDLLYISYICKLIPYINSFNITKLVLDNKELMLQQIDFMKEAYALERFAEKYKNNKEYRFPKVYKNITQRYNEVLVMENIKGLTLKSLETMDDAVKEEFAYIYLKFGILGILNYSAIHCDLHCGNVFFYINECTNDYTPKYQMGVIDFGLTCFPNKLNQNAYYIFLTQVLINKDYSQLFTVLHNVIEEKERFNAMPQLTKEALKKEICNSIELCIHNEINPKLIADFCKIFKNYNLNFTEEFHKLVLCLLNVNSFGNKLSKDVYACQMKLFNNLTSMYRLLEII
uniref:ABC1 atypical kinase-like domain-containing protein n=1 Tax=viral metagenome TaxID=1070528 RepID=A0A6C0CCZ4_9ZZZZ